MSDTYRSMLDRAWREMPLHGPKEKAGFERFHALVARKDLPRKTYRLPADFAPYDVGETDRVVEHNLKVLAAFRVAFAAAPLLAVMDPHHVCYEFDVSVALETVASREEIWGMKMYVDPAEYRPLWIKETFPEGNTTSFLSMTADLLYGYEFAHAGPREVFVIGGALIDAIDAACSPLLLG